jgi:hypothetical protein
MNGEQHLRELEEKYEDYKVYDRNGEKIGKVDDLFIDETDREEYIGVKLGFFGLKSTLIPMEVVRVNEAERRIEVSETKDTVKGAPTFSDDDEIDATFEENIRRHFNLESGSSGDRGSYGAYAGSGSTGTSGENRASTEHYGTENEQTAGRGAEGESSEGRGYEGAERQYDSSGDESDSGEQRDTEATQRGGVSGDETSRDTSSGETFSGTSGETRETSAGGSGTGEVRSEETVSEEGGEGRPKVRRRIIREEIIEEDPEQ